MSIRVPKTTDLEGTIAEFHDFFEKHKLYLHPRDIYGTSLNNCDIVQDEPRTFIRLTHNPISMISYVGTVLRDSRFGGRIEIYRIRSDESYKIALVKTGYVIDETGEVMSLMELAQRPEYVLNKGD